MKRIPRMSSEVALYHHHHHHYTRTRVSFLEVYIINANNTQIKLNKLNQMEELFCVIRMRLRGCCRFSGLKVEYNT